MSDLQAKNSINYLALLVGVSIAICLSIVGVISLIDADAIAGMFQLSMAIIFAYFSYREIKYGSIEPEDLPKE